MNKFVSLIIHVHDLRLDCSVSETEAGFGCDHFGEHALTLKLRDAFVRVNADVSLNVSFRVYDIVQMFKSG